MQSQLKVEYSWVRLACLLAWSPWERRKREAADLRTGVELDPDGSTGRHWWPLYLLFFKDWHFEVLVHRSFLPNSRTIPGLPYHVCCPVSPIKSTTDPSPGGWPSLWCVPGWTWDTPANCPTWNSWLPFFYHPPSSSCLCWPWVSAAFNLSSPAVLAISLSAALHRWPFGPRSWAWPAELCQSFSNQ